MIKKKGLRPVRQGFAVHETGQRMLNPEVIKYLSMAAAAATAADLR